MFGSDNGTDPIDLGLTKAWLKRTVVGVPLRFG